MFDVTFPQGQAENEAPSSGAEIGGWDLCSGVTDALDPWDGSGLSAVPDGDVFGWDDEDDEDDDVDDGDANLTDDFDDEED